MMKANVVPGKRVELVEFMGNDETVVQAARVSYQEGTRVKRNTEGLINFLMMNGHMSPFEFVEFTFFIEAPIFVARQWFRHRTGNYAEMSGRYSIMPVEMFSPGQPRFVKDHNEDSDVALVKQVFDDANSFAARQYHTLLDAGLVREQARSVLPLGTMTRFYYKSDLRNLLHFLKLRLSPHAQPEIRVYAEAILNYVRDIVPITIAAWENHVLNSVTLSEREWKTLISKLGADEVRNALLGAEPSKSRIATIERAIKAGD